MEMDMEWKWSGNGAQFVKIVWTGLDLGQSVDLKPYDRYRNFTKLDKSNTETRLYLIDWQICAKVEGLDTNTTNFFNTIRVKTVLTLIWIGAAVPLSFEFGVEWIWIQLHGVGWNWG